MARIRTIKPEFWVDEKIVELSPMARLLFIGLWNFCDDEGRMEYRPKKIKMQIFPADSPDMSALFGELRRELMVSTYIVDGKEYLQVLNFGKHQKIDKRSVSKYPAQPPIIKPAPNPPESPRALPLEGIKEGEVSGIKEREGIGGKDKTPVEKTRPMDIQKVFGHWQIIMDHPRAKLDPKRKKLINKQLDIYSTDDLLEAIDGCAKTPFNMGDNENGTTYDDLELILRDSAHIDKFIKHNTSPPSPQNPDDQRFKGNVAAAERAMEQIT